MNGHRFLAAVYDRLMAGTERAGLRQKRAELLRETSGRVLEIGAGTGLNLAHYPAGVTELVLIEPDPFMARRLRRRLAEASPSFVVDVAEAEAERLPFGDAEFDCVISTLVLCSVADPSRGAAEIARVLRPGGRLHLIEHVRSSESARLRRWQDRLERPWGWIAGGCHPNRDTAAILRAAGFELGGVVADEMPRGGLVKPLIRGSAAPASG